MSTKPTYVGGVPEAQFTFLEERILALVAQVASLEAQRNAARNIAAHLESELAQVTDIALEALPVWGVTDFAERILHITRPRHD